MIGRGSTGPGVLGEGGDGALRRLESALARAEGRRDALHARAASLTGEVELAKGRLALKGEVETFIEAAHGEANRRNLTALETLLTALVQEVLPGEKPVSLQLSAERGQPALDICVVRPDGSLEDVLEDNGGALTNVIGVALRLIAVVKANAGRFLALDEADCWIAPERVPAFYRVLEDAAVRLGVQCLAVSHHDLSAFDGQFHVSRIAGEPADGVGIVAPDLEARWDDAQPGLRHIRLLDVQAYSDATLRLSPGINALTGPNNRGKSTVIRALRAVFYGEARDSLVRAGAKAAIIEVGIQGGRILRFTRQPRRSPVNVWSLHEADGSIVEERGMRFESGGRAVPEWVEKLCRIVKVEDLDVHIAHQKFPVFLLGETPARRSAVLSIGQEAGYTRDMLAIHRERCLRDNNLVRAGERELIEIDRALHALEPLDDLRRNLDLVSAKAAELQASIARLESMRTQIERLGGLRAALAGAGKRLAATGDLPDAGRISALRDDLDRERERERLRRHLTVLSRAATRAKSRKVALQALPEGLPPLKSHAEAETSLTQLAALRETLAAAEARRMRVQAGLEALRADMVRLVEDAHGQCPTCGSAVDAESLFDRHLHSSPSVAA